MTAFAEDEVASNGAQKTQIATLVLNGHHSEAEMSVEPQNPETPEAKALFEEQESLSIVKELRSSEKWIEVTAYGHLSESARARSLTASTLRGDGKIALRPLKFFNKDKTECTIVAHLGRSLQVQRDTLVTTRFAYLTRTFLNLGVATKALCTVVSWQHFWMSIWPMS